MKMSRVVALCGVSHVAFASAGVAQEIHVLDTIVVSLVEEGQENIEATGGAVISEEDIQALSPKNVSELFARESAVTVAGGAGPARRIHVFGMEQSNLAVTIDGTPQAATSWHHTGSSVFDPAFLKSVEVEAGAAAADSGFAAAAGAVRYETVSAYDLLEPGEAIGGRASLSYGDNGQGVAGSLAGFGAYNGFDWLLMVSKQDGDDYETGDGDEVLGSAPGAGGVLAKLGYEFAEHRIELNYAHDEDKEDRTVKMNLYQSTDALYPMEVTRDTISLKYTTTAPTDQWDPEVSLYFSENDYWRPNYDHDGRLTNGDMALEEDQFGGKVQNVFTLDSGTVTAGLDFNQHDFSVDAYGDNGAGLRNFSTTQIGLFTQARLEFGRFDLSTGARYDFHRFDDWNGARFSDSGASANATLSYEVVDGVEIFAGASETWLGYVIGDYAYLHARAEPYITDPDFAAGKSQNVKVGFNANFGAFQGGLTYFKTTVEGRPNYGASALTNDADYESEGYTVNAAYSWGTGRVGVNYTDVDTSYDGEDIEPNGSTFMPVGDTAALYVDQEFAEYNLKVGGTVEWAGSIDYAGDYQSQSDYTLVNAYAEWQPQALQGTTLRLGVDNLFDETYYERSSFGNGTRATAIYAPGRTVSLTATLDF